MLLSELKADTNFLCGSTSASYPDADKVRNMNAAYQDVARLIWESQDGWQYDDSNATTLPIAKATLVHNQQDYSLPSTAQRVERVQIKNSEGDWIKLSQIDYKDFSTATQEFLGSGLPQHYDMIGRSIMLYPIPSSASVTLSAGLQLFFNRDVTEFAVTATTSTPGFATAFHRILSYAAAFDFEQDDTKKKFLAEQRRRLEEGLTRFYSRRMDERQATIKPHSKRNWRQYT